jgi:hypothetical protein
MSDLTTLRMLNARFVHNFVTNDVARHDSLLHPLFTAIQSDGSVLDRVAYLAGWARGFDPRVIPYWDTRGEHITVVGDTALVRATNVFDVVMGTRSWRAITYTDTYVRAGGSWLCLQAQLTAVTADVLPDPATIVNRYVHGVAQSL